MSTLEGLGRPVFQRRLSIAWWVIVAIVWLVLPATGIATSTIALFVQVGIYALIAYGVSLLFGDGGLLSLAHGGLWGIAAYTAVILTVDHNWSFWLTLPVAIVVTAAVSLLVGYPSLRVKGHYFVIVTLALAQLVPTIAENWRSVTGGELGLSILKPGARGKIVSLTSDRDWYYAVGVAVALVIVSLVLIRRSDLGRDLVAIRENEELAEAASIDTTRVKLIAFTIGGVFAAISGVIWANFIDYVGPNQFGATAALLIVLMVLLGGARSLAGPLLGAAFVVFLPERLGLTPTQNNVVEGVLLGAVILAFPRGFVPVLLDWFDKVRRRFGNSEGTGEAATAALPAGTPPPLVTTRDRLTPGEVVLEVTDISKRYGGVAALSSVSLQVRAGEVLAIVGPNGSGKSTLFGVASGFVKPDAGTVSWRGRYLGRSAPHVRARAGLVRTFQERMAFPELTVAENLRTALVGAGGPADADGIRALAQYVRLGHRLAVEAGSLSWGETRLLGIAIALAQDPQLLLLDEPFAGLSPAAAADVSDILRRLIADGYSLAVIDHEMSYLMPLCERVIVLDHGMKVFDGLPEDFVRDTAVADAYLGTVAVEL